MVILVDGSAYRAQRVVAVGQNIGQREFIHSRSSRRLHDADKSAWWVYISYALGIANNIFVATSPVMNKMMEEARSGFTDEKAIQKIFTSGASDFGISFIIGLLFFIFALIVFFMCLKDSEPQTTEYGDSPKYVDD